MSVDDAADIVLSITELGDKNAGLDLISKFSQDKFTPNIYEGTKQYRAIVLTNPIAVPVDAFIEIEGIRISDSLPAIQGDPNYAHYICRCRILERNNPHEQIPAPENLVTPSAEDVGKIGLHPFFATRSALQVTGAPRLGDIVWVTYEKGPSGGRMYKGQILSGQYLTPAGTAPGPPSAVGASTGPAVPLFDRDAYMESDPDDPDAEYEDPFGSSEIEYEETLDEEEEDWVWTDSGWQKADEIDSDGDGIPDVRDLIP